MSGNAWRIRARSAGGIEVLEREAIALPLPGPGEVRLRIVASGVNFIDVYHRSGLYPLTFPAGLGVEAAGVVEAVGADVTGWAPGDRAAWAIPTPGTYATHICVDANWLVPIPDGISDEVAAATLLKGFTCWMLVEQCARVRPGQIALVHAAAGGVGTLLIPWLKDAGAQVIAHAGTTEKARIALENGADHALSCPFDDLAEAVRSYTDGHGVDMAYDGVGAASWAASLGAMARRGLLISYGNASGPVPPVPPVELMKAGSIYLTRPTMYHYIDTKEARREASQRLFTMIADGRLKVSIGQRFPLERAADAHLALETRQTTGSTILYL